MASLLTPKLLNLSATTNRDKLSLVWLRDQDPTVKWRKWDGVVSSVKAYNYWSKNGGRIVGIVVTEVEGDSDTFFDELYTISKKVPIMLLSQTVLASKSQDYWSENYDNVLNLNTILRDYPFIKQAWDGTVGDAVAIFASLIHYKHLYGAQDCISAERVESLSGLGICVEESNKVPNEVWLITQFFKHRDNGRYKELKECLAKNCECEHIDKIVLLNEKDYSSEFSKLTGNEKVQQVIIKKRLTYGDFIHYVQESIPDNVIVILANADIYFADSLTDLHMINMEDKMLGLLRWDVDVKGEATVFGPRADSQDSWIFLSNSIRSRQWDFKKLDFQLGMPGCDNAFAGCALRQKFLLSNPALSFKSFHLHNTNIRNYDKSRDLIRSDIYINLVPTHIIDNKHLTVPPGKPAFISNEMVEFEVKSSSMSNVITYCTMLEKEGRYKWEPSVENFYFQPQIPLYTWKNACVTPNGLVYDYRNIYKGRYADSDETWNYWAESNVDIMTPLQKCDRMVAIPFQRTDVFKNPDTYILNYLSRCARLLKEYPGTTFWIPREYREYLTYFNWGDTKLRGVYFDDNTACYADEVVGYLPGPESSELGAEDIRTLRDMLPSWCEMPVDEKACVVVLGGEIWREFAEGRMADFFKGKSDEWSVRYVYEGDYASYDALLGASLCVFIGGKRTESRWAKLWALPVGCRVVEFQQELQIAGEFQHLAHVSGFESWVLLLSKGSVEDVQEQVMEQMEKWWGKNM